MLDTNKLKGKIRARNLSQQECANALGITLTAFNLKLNGYTNFSVNQAASLANIINLSSEEIIEIFFNYKLA